MRYKQFGQTGLSLSQLSVGTYAVGNAAWGNTAAEDYVQAIRQMIALGVNHLDTAINYGGGESERILGRMIGEFRDRICITTKGCFRQVDGKMVKDASRHNMLESCDVSLRRLGLDYIDIYMVHQYDPDTPIAETMDAMNTLQRAGKIRFIGVSNYTLEQLQEACRYANVSAIQVQYSMVARENEELMRWAAGHGIGVMTHGSLGAGILTGAFRTLPHFPEDDVRSRVYDYFREPKFSRIMGLLEVMEPIARSHGCPLSQVAVNWLTQKPYVHTALVGVRSVQEASENCGGMSWTLSDEEMQRLDTAIAACAI